MTRTRIQDKQYKQWALKIAKASNGCQGCGKDHTLETRLESSRRRRIAHIKRRDRRRELRQNPLTKWVYDEMKKMYLEEMDRLIKQRLFGPYAPPALQNSVEVTEDFVLAFPPITAVQIGIEELNQTIKKEQMKDFFAKWVEPAPIAPFWASPIARTPETTFIPYHDVWPPLVLASIDDDIIVDTVTFVDLQKELEHRIRAEKDKDIDAQ